MCILIPVPTRLASSTLTAGERAGLAELAIMQMSSAFPLVMSALAERGTTGWEEKRGTFDPIDFKRAAASDLFQVLQLVNHRPYFLLSLLFG